jgi:hypothetical protein
VQLYDRIDQQIRLVSATDRIVSVFAVPGDSHAVYLPRLVKFARRRGVPVYMVPIAKDTGERLIGLSSCPQAAGGRQCVILIDSGDGPNGRLYTLLHELAHLEQAGKVRTVDEAEVFAESVAFLVLSELGLDTSVVSASYLVLNTSEAARRRVLRELAPHVEAIAAMFLKAARG